MALDNTMLEVPLRQEFFMVEVVLALQGRLPVRQEAGSLAWPGMVPEFRRRPLLVWQGSMRTAKSSSC